MLVHPVIAESYATALDAPAAGDSLDADLPAAALDGCDLLQCFAGVSDGRSGQGRDHPVAIVLTLCAAAVLAGMRSFTAIAGWVADVPAELLAPLYGRHCECLLTDDGVSLEDDAVAGAHPRRRGRGGRRGRRLADRAGSRPTGCR